MSVELIMPSNHLILFCNLLLLPSIFPSIRVFSNESVLHIRWPNYWSFSVSPSNEYSGLISFRIDWLDLLAVHGTLKSLLQHHSSKASILWCSAFFIVQLSHPHMTIGKTIALTRQTFVSKVMSPLFNMLSNLVMAFLLRSKCLLNCLNFFSFFFFILFCDCDFPHSIFKVTYTFFCLGYSLLTPSSVFFISVIVLFTSVHFFISSRSLLMFLASSQSLPPFFSWDPGSSSLSLFWILFLYIAYLHFT